MLAIILLINLIYGIFMAHAKSLEDKYMNYQDIANEIIIAATFYWKILYTGIIHNFDVL